MIDDEEYTEEELNDMRDNIKETVNDLLKSRGDSFKENANEILDIAEKNPLKAFELIGEVFTSASQQEFDEMIADGTLIEVDVD